MATLSGGFGKPPSAWPTNWLRTILRRRRRRICVMDKDDAERDEKVKREKTERLARVLCIRARHDPDQMVTIPGLPLEQIHTPRGIVYKPGQLHPLWMAWGW